MSKKVKEQMAVAQVYDDDVTTKKRMLRRGKTGKHRKSKKGPRRSKSSKKSSSSPTLSTHSPSKMDRNNGGLFGSTSDSDREWYYLYFNYDLQNWKKGPSCSITNFHYEKIPGYSIVMNCAAMTTMDNTRYYYKLGVGVIKTYSLSTGATGHANYFNEGIDKKNAWVTLYPGDTYDEASAKVRDLPKELQFSMSLDLTLGECGSTNCVMLTDFRIGMGPLISYPHHWWIADKSCEYKVDSFKAGRLKPFLDCSTSAVLFHKSEHDSPEHVPDNVIEIIEF